VLSRELGGYLAAEVVGFRRTDRRWKRNFQGRLFGPIGIACVEVGLGASRAQQAEAELAGEHLRARPLARMADEPRCNRVRQRVGDLLHHRFPCREAHGARRFVIPHRPFPGSEHLRSERDDTVEELQEARQHAVLVSDDEVEMRRHRAERVDLDPVASRGDGQGVDEKVGYRRVGTQEQVAAQDATREEIGCAREDRTRLGHDWKCDKRRASGRGE
jgi:hypothetical protein